MRKSRLSITLMTALLSVGTLTGCDKNYVSYSPEGTLVSYTVGGETQNITAEQIFAEYYNDSDKYQSIFDAIKSIIVRNYFSEKVEPEKVTVPDGKGGTKEISLGNTQVAELKIDAQRKVDSDKHQAKLNAKNNSTTYDKEFESILSSKGVETEDELFDKYLDELKTAKFDENFYKYHLDEIKNGSTEVKDGNGNDFWTGYFNDMLPYHVSHILVKLEDSSATNYYNGTVSEANCEKLYNVVDALANKTDKFQMTARFYSDDEGSAAKYGDLGIMDYSTSFVNEFKLGVYAYEKMFGDTTNVTGSKIDIARTTTGASLEENFISETEELYDASEVPTVDIKVFEDLYKVRKQTKSTKFNEETGKYDYDEEVMENNTLVYPRNLIYNQYLNKHSFAFVTTETPANFNTDLTADGDTGFVEGSTYSSKLEGKSILSVRVSGQNRPILMVRAGTSDYQGIHFIVVNRDPFENPETDKTTGKVSRDDYYTTYHINQDGYPKDAVQTYVSFNSEFGGQDSNSRADTFVSTLKSFDSDKLSKYIFKKYLASEQIKITDKNLAYALETWIDKNLQSKATESNTSWENVWTDYVGTLRKQNDERTKLMSQACRIGFDQDVNGELTEASFKTYLTEVLGWDDSDAEELVGTIDFTKLSKVADLYNMKGALCNDGKEYK